MDEQFFTFNLSGGLFAIEVSKVQEVLNFEHITKVPKAKPYMLGVINNRGAVVTVIDLRILFGFEIDLEKSKNAIVICEIKTDNDKIMPLGILADEVNVVTKLEMIESDATNYGALPERSDFVKSVAKINNEFVLILDLDKILDSIKQEIAKK